MSKDQCNPPTDITVPDIYGKISDLADKMGASAVCKKAAQTDALNFASSGGVSAGGYGVNAEGHYQVSGGAVHNTMEESGCGPIMLAAQKIISNSKQIQCIIQRAAKTSTTTVTLANALTITTTPLSVDEIATKNNFVMEYKAKNPLNEYINQYMLMIDSYNLSVERYNSKNPSSQRTTMEPSIKDATDSYNSTIKMLTESFDRSIYWDGVEVNQKISGQVKIIGNLTDDDKTQIESLANDIAKTVAETDTQQKMGVNALTPSVKSATDTTVSSNKNMSSTQIAEKIANINAQFQATNATTITIPGKVVMKNVKFDQEIAVDLVTQSIVSSAIDAGIRASAETQLSSDTKQKVKQESRGVDDIIKAQGDANAAAIKAGNAANWSAIIGVVCSSVIMIVLIYFDQKETEMLGKYNIQGRFSLLTIAKWFMVVILMFFIIFGIILLVKLFSPKSDEDKLKSLNRPLKVYQDYWKVLGCDKVLTFDDVIAWDGLKSDLDVSIQMRNDHEDAVRDKKTISGMHCYSDINTTTTKPKSYNTVAPGSSILLTDVYGNLTTQPFGDFDNKDVTNVASLRTGPTTVTGLISAGSLTTTGQISAGAISAGSLTTTGAISAGSLSTPGSLTATGPITAGSLSTGTIIATSLTLGSQTLTDIELKKLKEFVNQLPNITANLLYLQQRGGVNDGYISNEKYAACLQPFFMNLRTAFQAVQNTT